MKTSLVLTALLLVPATLHTHVEPTRAAPRREPTLPAVVDAMALALEHFGTMRLEQVMAPAIELADGFPMYAFLRDFLISNEKSTRAYKWGKSYYPNGTIPEVGEVFRQPNLART